MAVASTASSMSRCGHQHEMVVRRTAGGHHDELMTAGAGGAEDEVALTGGGRTQVWRRGDVVLRPATPWSGSVNALLQHLSLVGFDGSPRPVGSGVAADGREAVTFIPGTFVHPRPWSDDGVAAVGALLRRLHEAVATFVPPADAVWKPWYGRALGDAPRIIGHCDTGAWNIVARDGVPTALIDWETAGPVDPLVELAQASWLNAQLMGDAVTEAVGLGTTADRARQLRLLVDAYGLPRAERERLLELMVHVAVTDAKVQADEGRVTPTSTDPTPLWAMAWRIASAEWMLRHRRTLLNALQ
jgi:hypothetical protein